MKRIKIKDLHLVNFKGARDVSVTFNDDTTDIIGDNGTGKTTIYDAFLWLLFGKNSEWKSDFNIKPLDSEGNALHKAEYSVEGTLLVDDVPVNLQRIYKEKWVKKRGASEDVLGSHTTEFSINNVPVGTKKEYDEYISSLVSEDLFKMLTTPSYFPSLSPDNQKAILMEMAGEITDTDVVSRNEDFQSLLDMMKGKDVAKFIAEIEAKKRKIKERLDIIPAQLETAQKLMPETSDNEKYLKEEIEIKENEISSIQLQISDTNERNKAYQARMQQIRNSIARKERELINRESEIHSQVASEYLSKQVAIHDAEAQLKKNAINIRSIEDELSRYDSDIEKLENKMSPLRDRFIEIDSQEMKFDDSMFVCPTCKRPFDQADIDVKKEELISSFNVNKAQSLKNIQTEGISLKNKKETILMQKEGAEKRIQQLIQEGSQIQEQIEILKQTLGSEPNSTEEKKKDHTCIKLQNEIQELNNMLSAETTATVDNSLMSRLNALNSEKQELLNRKNLVDQKKRCQLEIDTLEKNLEAMNVELTEIESINDLANEFVKERDNILQERIDSLFSVCKFSFTKERLNGSDKITCVLTINGTPYSDANKASQVNAGLDIINALCTKYDVSVPIFIDNRESVNSIIHTVSQVINLKVGTYETLQII